MHLLHKRLAAELLWAAGEILSGVSWARGYDWGTCSCGRVHHGWRACWVMLVGSLLWNTWCWQSIKEIYLFILYPSCFSLQILSVFVTINRDSLMIQTNLVCAFFFSLMNTWHISACRHRCKNSFSPLPGLYCLDWLTGMWGTGTWYTAGVWGRRNTS